MDNYGIIIRHLRGIAGLTVQQAASKIGRSKGWLSEIENGRGRCRLLEAEFNRIVDLFDAAKHRSMFKTWTANTKNRSKVKTTFDGAILKFIRLKHGMSLEKAATAAGISRSQISKLEVGKKL